MKLLAILKWVKTHKNIATTAILSLCVAFLLAFNVTLKRDNKKLSESLEIAQNNIEAYQGSLSGSQQANIVLKMDMNDLSKQNDKLLQQLDSVRKERKIKPSQITTAATQTQIIYVNESKGVQGDLITILKDSVYKDTIQYNDQTKVSYTIGKDTVNIGLDIHNTQYLYTFKTREYKNKKSFLKRLFTLDFKKVDRYRYEIVNTNDLLKTDSVRVVESK